MRQQRPAYETPRKAWYQPRIQSEKQLLEDYGLKNKKEIWKTQSTVRTWRREARKLTAEQDVAREQELIQKLQGLGLLEEDAHLDDILELTTSDLLDRRLQTVVYRKGLANTVKQARQFVVHGHVRINRKRVDIPSYMVRINEEDNITVSDHVLQHVKGEAADARSTPATETGGEETLGEAGETSEEETTAGDGTEEEDVEPAADVDEDESSPDNTPETETGEDTADSDTVTAESIVASTIDDAKEQLEAFDGDLQTVLEAEKNNKNRSTFIDWLENRIED